MASSCTCVPEAAFTLYAGAVLGNKDSVLQILKTSVLVFDSCFELWRNRHRGGQPSLNFSLLKAPPPPTEVTSRGLKVLVPLTPHSFFWGGGQDEKDIKN